MATEKRVHGDFIPIFKPQIGPDLFDPNLSNFDAAAKNVLLDEMDPDVVTDAGKKKAIVLYSWEEDVESNFRTSPAGSPMLGTNRYYICRIPELCTALAPKRLPRKSNVTEEDDPEVDWEMIKSYPIFSSKETQPTYDLPQPRDLVYVDFENRAIQEGAFLVGPVIGDGRNRTISGSPGRETTAKDRFPPGTVHPRRKFNLKGNWTKGLDKKRVLYIAKQLELEPDIIAAFQMVESSGNPTAFAFNVHVMRKRIKEYYGPTSAKTKELQEKMRNAELSEIRSVYKTKAQTLFDLAYSQIDPKTAVAGGAWGNYQVLGSNAYKIDYIKNSPDPPSAVLESFVADPERFSDDMFIAWVKNNGGVGGKWWTAANNPTVGDGYGFIVTKYAGERKEDYINKLRTYHEKFIREGTFTGL